MKKTKSFRTTGLLLVLLMTILNLSPVYAKKKMVIKMALQLKR